MRNGSENGGEDVQMKRMSIVLAMSTIAGVASSCGSEKPKEPVLGSAKTALRTASMIDKNSDVTGMKYTVTPCNSPSNPIIVDRPLEDQILPGNIPELANNPLDKDSSHLYADLFLTVTPGCYNISVQPTTAAGGNSAICAPAWKSGVQVAEGETVEVFLMSQCAGNDPSAIDTIAAINHEPSLSKVAFDSSKFVCGGSERICVFGSDVDKDPLEFELVVPTGCTVSGPPIPHFGEACFSITCHDWGRVALTAKVYDLVWSNGQFVRIEKWLSDEGYPNESHGQLQFFAYFDGIKYYPDVDQDGFGDKQAVAALVCDGDAIPAGFVLDRTDCNDSDPTVNPAAQEICNDSIDSNCDDSLDASCQCPPNTIDCGGQCVSNACTGGGIFNMATCACECPTGTTTCGGQCVNTSCTDGKLFDPTTCTCQCPPNSTAHPVDIHVYYLQEWNYHWCDSAVFNVDMNGVPLGQINLNNGNDGGTRHAYLTASEAQVTTAAATRPIRLNFVCALPGCHSNVGYVEATNPLNGAVLYSGQQNSSVLQLSVCF